MEYHHVDWQHSPDNHGRVRVKQYQLILRRQPNEELRFAPYLAEMDLLCTAANTCVRTNETVSHNINIFEITEWQYFAVQ